MHHPTDRISHTTVFVTPVVEHWLEREIAQWVYPMKDRSDDPSHHERTRFKKSCSGARGWGVGRGDDGVIKFVGYWVSHKDVYIKGLIK